jgi:starch synthase
MQFEKKVIDSKHDVRSSALLAPAHAQRPWRKPIVSVPAPWPIAVHDTSAIVHLTAEYWPYARTGGLGEAVAGLAMAQARSGRRVVVFMPLYRSVRERSPVELVPIGPAYTIDMGSRRERVQVYRDPSTRFGPEVRFVDAPSFFDRPGLYGDDGGDYADNDQRFALFCLAALTDAASLDTPVAVIHAHDWHAALAPVFLRADPRFAELASSSTVVSVHNAAFQGQFDRSVLDEMDFLRELRDTGGIEAYGRLNLLKGALTLADVVVTVSPTHALDLTSELGGFGLHDSFRALGDRFVGIANGIDQRLWNPVNDPFITAAYSADDLSGKAACKAALQAEYGLKEDADVPIFTMSARLTEQKGFDIVLASDFVRSSHAQFVFLGTGEQRYQDALRRLAQERPSQVAAEFDFTDEREHKLLAGADFLLMPSLFEPCGLTQMRAQRYGALVVARRVGGLRDTVDSDVGFLFDEYDPAQLSEALWRAERAFRDEALITDMRRRAMARDFGWPAVVPAYAAVYERAAGHGVLTR